MNEVRLSISYNTPYSTDCRVGMKLAVVQFLHTLMPEWLHIKSFYGAKLGCQG